MRNRALRSGAALRGGGPVLAALVVWNAGNYAFFLLAGRALGPSEYGLAAALLAATLVVAVPAQALQFAAARLVAAPPGGDPAVGEWIYQRAWRRCAAATPVVALAAGAVVAGAAAAGLVNAGPLLATLLLVLPLGFLFLALGRLQGEERFAGFAVCFALWGAPRPLALFPLAAAGLGVYAALGATGAAVMAALAASVWLTRGRAARREPPPSEWRRFTRPLVPLVAGLSGLGLVTNLDVIVAKLVLAPERAGEFAAAGTLAKAVFIVPQAVSFVLLPRVAARSAAAHETGTILALAVALTLVAGGLASLAMWFVAEPILALTYGEEFTGLANLLGIYAAASTLVGVLIVLINHHVARSGDRFLWAAAAVALLQAPLFLVFHGSPEAIVAVYAVVGTAGLLLHEIMFLRTGEAFTHGLVLAVRRVRAPVHEPH